MNLPTTHGILEKYIRVNEKANRERSRNIANGAMLLRSAEECRSLY